MAIERQSIADNGQFLSEEAIKQTLFEGLSKKYSGAKLLILIPDRTRSIPMPMLFRMMVEILDDVKQLDFMVALGTHPPLNDDALNQWVGITADERNSIYKHVGLLNHDWQNPTTLIQIGNLEKAQIQAIAGDLWHPSLGDDTPVRINRRIQDYDHILILGPTFPHEIIGFSGGAKYLFPGISGAEMINTSHWLGALAGNLKTAGIAMTPVRNMLHAAATFVTTPITLISMVVVGKDLAGVFVGDHLGAWQAAVNLSSERHIIWLDQPLRRVLSQPDTKYYELWTAAKAMGKLEAVIADGGEIILYAPYLHTVSDTHGKYIYEAGYHTIDYYLKQWDKFKHLPLSVLTHCTHMRGNGVFEDGIENTRIQVTLASQISAEECRKLSLPYLNPDEIDLNEWQNREDEGVMFVPKAGEMLYRLKKDMKH